MSSILFDDSILYGFGYFNCAFLGFQEWILLELVNHGCMDGCVGSIMIGHDTAIGLANIHNKAQVLVGLAMEKKLGLYS